MVKLDHNTKRVVHDIDNSISDARAKRLGCGLIVVGAIAATVYATIVLLPVGFLVLPIMAGAVTGSAALVAANGFLKCNKEIRELKEERALVIKNYEKSLRKRDAKNRRNKKGETKDKVKSNIRTTTRSNTPNKSRNHKMNNPIKNSSTNRSHNMNI